MSEPIISDDEALAFLKGRVPPAKPQGDYAIDDLCDLASDNGFNACRNIVLKGSKA